MAGRLLILAVAIVLAGFGAIALHDDDACQTQARRMVDVGLGTLPARAQYADAFLDACRGSHLLAITANGLAGRRKTELAVRIADEAIRREPENYESWVALATALRQRGLPEAADRALRQARRLNPRFGRGPG